MDKKNGVIATNRRAKFDYFLEDKIIAGIELTGTEIKSVREKKVSLSESWVEIKDNQVYLNGATIQPWQSAGAWVNHEPNRTRKLLLTKSDIAKLNRKTVAKGVTIIPTKMFFKGSWAKCEIAIARGKKQYDKRQTIKQRQDKIAIQASVKNYKNFK